MVHNGHFGHTTGFLMVNVLSIRSKITVILAISSTKKTDNIDEMNKMVFLVVIENTVILVSFQIETMVWFD